jgi:lauroyl/myristoyl acyltransferase
MKFEELPKEDLALALILKRNQMKRETWIKNVQKVYPEMTLEEIEKLHDKIFKK